MHASGVLPEPPPPDVWETQTGIRIGGPSSKEWHCSALGLPKMANPAMLQHLAIESSSRSRSPRAEGSASPFGLSRPPSLEEFVTKPHLMSKTYHKRLAKGFVDATRVPLPQSVSELARELKEELDSFNPFQNPFMLEEKKAKPWTLLGP